MTTTTIKRAATHEPRCGADGAATAADLVHLSEAMHLAMKVARGVLGQQTHDGLDAEDVAQEVVLRLAALDASGLHNWRAWVTTVARNRALDVRSAERRHAHQPIPGVGGGAAPGEPGTPLPRQLRHLGPSCQVLANTVWTSATEVLGAKERRVLGAHLDGWTNQEIAVLVGYASAASVAVTLTRARAKVRAAFPPGAARDLLLGEVRLY